ncbi:MAG: TolC family protein [Chitinophagaceae bacterium]|nr:TolC family protein [Chitinophagaceae bacterium]
MHKRTALLFSLLTVLCSDAFTQTAASDTISLTVKQAEEIFLQKNLELIAAGYDIRVKEALVQQVHYWDNPTLNTDQNLYDGNFFRYAKPSPQFPVGRGQIFMQLQQVLVTAGKRQKLVQMAKDNVARSKNQFNDLMRNLRFVLISDLNNLYQLQTMEALYKQELFTLRKLSEGMDEMLKVGNISQRDNIRIKGLVFALQSEYNDNLRDQQDLQKEIRIFLQLPDTVKLRSLSGTLLPSGSISRVQLKELIDSALQLRPDLAAAHLQKTYNQHNLRYQKALNTPNVTIGPNYDMRNSYILNYVGLSFNVPLPLWNRNKGNIKAAEISISQAGTMEQQLQNTISNEVAAAYQKLIISSEMVSNINQEWQGKYDDLLANMLSSYKERQVSLVEFVDFFDSYKNTRLLELQQISNIRNAAAEINFVTNTNFFNL